LGRCTEGTSGYCESFCGLGRGCCKRGASGDPPECKRAIGFSSDHHQCVVLAMDPEAHQAQGRSFDVALAGGGLGLVALCCLFCGGCCSGRRRGAQEGLIPEVVPRRVDEGKPEGLRHRKDTPAEMARSPQAQAGAMWY